MKHFEDLGARVDEITFDVDDLEGTFMALRSQQFVIDRELQIAEHGDQIKPDIIWNTEIGLKQSTSDLARAERARAELYRRFVELFETYDLLVTPGANTPAFDVNLRHPEAIDGVRLEHYLGASLLTSAITLSASPALSLPCGFDQFGRPVGLQLVGRTRGEAAVLAAGALFEGCAGLASLVPIDPRPGEVPPV
jgi:amidase